MTEYNLTHQLENAFSSFPDHKAISFFRNGMLDSAVTYEELNFQIALFMENLPPYALNKGDRVMLYMEKSLMWVIAYLSLLRMGVICVPLNPGFTKKELAYLR